MSSEINKCLNCGADMKLLQSFFGTCLLECEECNFHIQPAFLNVKASAIAWYNRLRLMPEAGEGVLGTVLARAACKAWLVGNEPRFHMIPIHTEHGFVETEQVNKEAPYDGVTVIINATIPIPNPPVVEAEVCHE